ncbi:hypothetical protein [Culicoidibacter larvae]|uniref:Uncharacterized protein n=1 Tax=Culicoidibacter larvae TaxID=2579976 RepID=A0A5R8Q7R2_9FIRM|nr:hypothetical protein [Culicoidibacter larvae]TLG71171.1 hypothetical protein FEZ08_11495 [Culicoidibacter larvae]
MMNKKDERVFFRPSEKVSRLLEPQRNKSAYIQQAILAYEESNTIIEELRRLRIASNEVHKMNQILILMVDFLIKESGSDALSYAIDSPYFSKHPVTTDIETMLENNIINQQVYKNGLQRD